MEAVLRNLANRYLLDYCLTQGIDPSGSHTEKDGRGFSYKLIKDETGEAIARITFTKNSTPVYGWR